MSRRMTMASLVVPVVMGIVMVMMVILHELDRVPFNFPATLKLQHGTELMRLG